MATAVEESAMLTLAEALKSGRLAEFIEQEERRGIGPVQGKRLHRAFAKAIKSPKPKDPTSRSASGGDSNGK